MTAQKLEPKGQPTKPTN